MPDVVAIRFGSSPSAGGSHRKAAFPRLWPAACLVGMLLVATVGCGSTEWLRRTDSLAPWTQSSLKEWSRRPLEPSPRTLALLRRYDLADQLRDPQGLLDNLQRTLEREQTPELLYAYAETAFLAGQKIEPVDRKRAFDIYSASAAHAYLYLFDDRFAEQRNPYDPQFRAAGDIYNKSLDRALRFMAEEGGLRPGAVHTCNALDHQLEVRVVARRASWRGHDIERFEFVSDYETVGLQQQYRSYGLGVPLIAVRRRQAPPGEDPSGVERFYPDTLALPATAFLRLDSVTAQDSRHRPRMRAVLELVDPLVTREVYAARSRVPIESDLTTPIAYGLDNMQIDDFRVSTFGMLRGNRNREHHGLFMMEPYQPHKIPVVFVHGLWSSPITWVEMFNDLRGDPEIRDRYQFWYYFYPTGQPFLYTGKTLRRDLAELRETLDPAGQQPTLDRMVLVGHSMGGLVSKLQAVDSGREFWDQVAQKPFSELDVDERTREELAEMFFFQANPSVRRVVTIATPHRGSRLSNSATRWLARNLFSLPRPLTDLNARLQDRNPGVFRFRDPFHMPTSIEALSPKSPELAALHSRPRPDWVIFNNVIGEVEDKNWFSRFHGPSDGVVPLESAKAPHASSEVLVQAGHQDIHRHPLTVLELRRVLREHLAMLDREDGTRHAEHDRPVPATGHRWRHQQPTAWQTDRGVSKPH